MCVQTLVGRSMNINTTNVMIYAQVLICNEAEARAMAQGLQYAIAKHGLLPLGAALGIPYRYVKQIPG